MRLPSHFLSNLTRSPQHSWEEGPRKSHARARLHEVSSVQHSIPPTERLVELADDATGPKYNDLKVGRNRRGSVTVVFMLSFSEIRRSYGTRLFCQTR